MEEAFSFENDYDSWSSSGFYCPYPTVGNFADPPAPQRYKNICFKEDLQSLGGLTGTVTEQDTLEKRSYVLGGPLNLT